MRAPTYPSLYQINTRVWQTELSKQLGRPAMRDDVSDSELDRLRQCLQKRGRRLMLDFVPDLAGLDPSIPSCGC
jgi:hypothetical protein